LTFVHVIEAIFNKQRRLSSLALVLEKRKMCYTVKKIIQKFEQSYAFKNRKQKCQGKLWTT